MYSRKWCQLANLVAEGSGGLSPNASLAAGGFDARYAVRPNYGGVRCARRNVEAIAGGEVELAAVVELEGDAAFGAEEDLVVGVGVGRIGISGAVRPPRRREAFGPDRRLEDGAAGTRGLRAGEGDFGHCQSRA